MLIRDPAERFASQALRSTDLDATSPQIVEWFVLRWQLEVTLHEVRAHRGVETHRQWSDLAILRTTPALFALFSRVTLLARHLGRRIRPTRQVVWYDKSLPTFIDARAAVRRKLWPSTLFAPSPVISRARIDHAEPAAVRR